MLLLLLSFLILCKAVVVDRCGGLKCTIEDNVLTFKGNGYMKPFFDSPMCRYENIYKVIIENGVKSIGDNAFMNCNKLTTVEISDSLETIGKNVFMSCTSLESIKITDSVTSIGDSAFSNCKSLKSINIPGSVKTIGDYVFSQCTSLESINVDESNLNYSSQDGVLFNKGKTELIQYPIGSTNTSYSIPDSVESIHPYAFAKSTLESINIPHSVTTIGDNVFSQCTSLESINVDENSQTFESEDGVLFNKGKTLLIQYPIGSPNTSYSIPDSVVTINGSSFWYCKSLESINVDENNPNYSSEDGVLFNKGKTYLIQYPIGSPNTSYVIPISVSIIGPNSFSQCTTLTSIDIPNSIETIDEFETCTSIKKISIYGQGEMKKLTYCYTFLNISEIVIKSGITSIPDNAFLNCRLLTSVSISNSVGVIGTYSFSGCSSLTSITIPESVTNINDGAFMGCSSLTSINIPEKVTIISAGLFSLCTSLKIVNIHKSITSIGNYAFFGCTSLTSFEIPEKVSDIGEHSFNGCTSLTSIHISTTLTTIGYQAFFECTSLESISVDENNPNYSSQDGVLFNKTKTKLIQYPASSPITKYGIPETVSIIESYAFKSCSKLTTINIHDSVKTIGNEAFSQCTSLESINVNENNPNYSSQDGVLFNKGKTELIQYPIGSPNISYSISDSVGSIHSYAFAKSTLESINIPHSVTIIGDYVFSQCTSLTSINVDENSQTFESEDGVLFNKGKTELIQYPIGSPNISYSIPDSVESIHYYAFAKSTLESINIPRSVKSINDNVFSQCTSLKSINVDENNPNFESEDGVLFYKGKTYLIQYPIGSPNTSYVTPISVSIIGPNSFSQCTTLTSIDIPSNYIDIDRTAFHSCSKLKCVSFEGTSAHCLSNDIFEGTLINNTIHVSSDYIGSALCGYGVVKDNKKCDSVDENDGDSTDENDGDSTDENDEDNSGFVKTVIICIIVITILI